VPAAESGLAAWEAEALCEMVIPDPPTLLEFPLGAPPPPPPRGANCENIRSNRSAKNRSACC